jgi:hypothetical protein
LAATRLFSSSSGLSRVQPAFSINKTRALVEDVKALADHLIAQALIGLARDEEGGPARETALPRQKRREAEREILRLTASRAGERAAEREAGAVARAEAAARAPTGEKLVSSVVESRGIVEPLRPPEPRTFTVRPPSPQPRSPYKQEVAVRARHRPSPNEVRCRLPKPKPGDDFVRLFLKVDVLLGSRLDSCPLGMRFRFRGSGEMLDGGVPAWKGRRQAEPHCTTRRRKEVRPRVM